jgi:hypothetical protein
MTTVETFGWYESFEAYNTTLLPALLLFWLALIIFKVNWNGKYLLG